MRGETCARLAIKTKGRVFQSTPLIRGETPPGRAEYPATVFQSTPLIRGETVAVKVTGANMLISIHSPHTRGDRRGKTAALMASMISIHSPHARGDLESAISGVMYDYFNPLPSCEGRRGLRIQARAGKVRISIRSPHARGDSISLQKSIRIYVSLHNKTMIHRFSGLYKPLFAAQSPIFGVRSPWESHDSFTFARPSAGRGITP